MAKPRKTYHHDKHRDGISTYKLGNRWRLKVWDSNLKRYRSSMHDTEDDALAAGKKRAADFTLQLDDASRCTLDGVWNSYCSERYGLNAAQVSELDAAVRAKAERTESGVTVESLTRLLKADRRTIVSMKAVVDGLREAGATDFKSSKGFRAAVSRYFNTLELTRSKSKEGQAAVSTRRRMMSQVRALVNHATNAGWLIRDPLAGYSPVGDREQDDTNRETFTLAEARTLVGLDRYEDPVWTHVMLMLYGGLREAEARALTWADLDRDARLMWIRKGKGNKVRAVPVQAELFEILTKLSDIRGPTAQVACLPSTPIVFLKPGRAVIYQNFVDLLETGHIKQERGTDAITGMPRRLNRHSCRHTYCACMLATGFDGDTLRIVMGHGDKDLTMHYGAQMALYSHQVSREQWPQGRLCFREPPATTTRTQTG